MKTNNQKTLLLTCVVACLALPAAAADRMRPGQWVGVTTVGSETFNTSACISQSDADAMNGDAKSVRAYLEKHIPAEICKLTDIKVNGGQVIYTAVCKDGAPNVVTTNHRGNSFEGTSTDGTKAVAKLTGACK